MATSVALAMLRQFRALLAQPFTLLSHVFLRTPLRHFFPFTTARIRSIFRPLLSWAGMASPVDSTISLDDAWQCRRPPLNHRMVHLKTKEECRLGNETLQVWTVEMPSKHAEGILKVVKDAVEGQDSIDLQHLRRFAKPRYLPTHVLGKPDKIKELYSVSRAWDSTPHAMQEPTSTAWEWTTPAKSRLHCRPPTLHLLICPVKLIMLQDLHQLLLQHAPFSSSADSWAYPLEIKEITVPKLAPTSPAQAAEWSDEYWPTFYRKTNPFGAHPTNIAKAEEELHYPAEGQISVEEAMALAKRAAQETQTRGFGVSPGAVIVERCEGTTEIVAVAGDARFKHSPRGPDFDETQANGCQGNVMSHAVMRAIGMVGRKRLRVASPLLTSRAQKAERNFANCGLDHDERARDDFFLDLPVTPLEQHYFDKDNIKPDGYLCLRLEVFLTHEPCVMCCMALVHSRVGRVIFSNRMPDTGGLTAEVASNDTGPVGLGYGLCWRKELNWQFMCWEYVPEEPTMTTHGEGARPLEEHQQQQTLQRKTSRRERVGNGGMDGSLDDDIPPSNASAAAPADLTTATTTPTTNTNATASSTTSPAILTPAQSSHQSLPTPRISSSTSPSTTTLTHAPTATSYSSYQKSSSSSTSSPMKKHQANESSLASVHV